MENTISIYQQALEEKAFLERQIGELEKRIKKYPKGKLICCKSDNHVKWYLSENGERQYLRLNLGTAFPVYAEKRYMVSVSIAVVATATKYASSRLVTIYCT